MEVVSVVAVTLTLATESLVRANVPSERVVALVNALCFAKYLVSSKFADDGE